MSKKRSMVTMVTAVLVALCLAACGSSGGGAEQSSKQSQTGAPTEASSAAASQAPSVAKSEEAGQVSDLHSLLPAKIQSSGVLRFVVQQHPPYTVINGSKMTGANQDLEAALAQELGVKAESVDVEGGLAPLLAGLLSGKYDLAMGPVTVSSDRLAQFDIVAWTVQKIEYVVKKSEVTNASDAFQLCGKTLSAVSDSVILQSIANLSKYCEAHGKAAVKSLPLATTNDLVLAVKSGRAFGAGTTDAAVESVISNDNTLTAIPQPSAAVGSVYNQGTIMTKESGLAKAIYAAMQALYEDGTYSTIMKKYKVDATDKPLLNVVS